MQNNNELNFDKLYYVFIAIVLLLAVILVDFRPLFIGFGVVTYFMVNSIYKSHLKITSRVPNGVQIFKTISFFGYSIELILPYFYNTGRGSSPHDEMYNASMISFVMNMIYSLILAYVMSSTIFWAIIAVLVNALITGFNIALLEVV